MIRLLLDMGLPRRTASDLREAGWDATHVGELSRHRAPDHEIIALARADGRTIITLDSDFAGIVATTQAPGPSILHLRLEGLDRERASSLLRGLLPTVDPYLTSGSIVVVTGGGIRVRPLPIR